MLFGNRRRPGHVVRAANARRSQSGPTDYMAQFHETQLPPQGVPQPIRHEQPVAPSRYGRGMNHRPMQPEVEPTAATSRYARVRTVVDDWSEPRTAHTSPAYTQAVAAAPHPTSSRATTGSRGDLDVKSLLEQVTKMQEDLDAMRTTQAEWEKIWKEIGDALYEEVGEVDVDQLPYYENLPSKPTDLHTPAGKLKVGTEIQLRFPQYKSCKLLFQRMTLVDGNNGSIRSYYVPLRNISMREKSIEDDLGLGDGTKKTFVTRFRPTGIDK